MTDAPLTHEEHFTQRPELIRATLITQLGCMGVIIFVLAWVLGSVLAGFAGLEQPFVALVGVLVALVILGVAVGVRYRQLKRGQETSRMTVGPQGISMSEMHGAVRSVEWPQLRAIAQVRPVVGLRRGQHFGPDGSKAANAASMASALPELGLVGLGTIDLSDVSGTMQHVYAQNEGINGTDPQSGRPFVALYPLHFEDDFVNGRIGAWIRSYRPDLLDTYLAEQAAES